MKHHKLSIDDKVFRSNYVDMVDIMVNMEMSIVFPFI